MSLTYPQSRRVVEVALACVGRNHEPGFGCVDFVRHVYLQIGIKIPLLSPETPPREYNITRSMLNNPPNGAIVFLKDPTDLRLREWTHVAIALPEKKIIHNSIFFGRRVTVLTLAEVLTVYEFAPSQAKAAYR